MINSSSVIQDLKKLTWRYGQSSAFFLNFNLPLLREVGENAANCFRSDYAICAHFIKSYMFLVRIKNIDVVVEINKTSRILSVGFPKKLLGNANIFNNSAQAIINFLEFLETYIEIDWEKTSLFNEFSVNISKNSDGKILIKMLPPLNHEKSSIKHYEKLQFYP